MATFTNRATLSYNGITVDSNTVVGTFNEFLSITKTSLSDDYGDGERATYVISLVNAGTTPLTGIDLTDDLGGYIFGAGTVYPLAYVSDSLNFYVNGTLQPTPAITGTSPLTLSGITVPAGGNALIVYQADITGFAPLATGGTITNTATASGGSLAEAVTDSATVTAVAEPLLSIVKGLSPVVVGEDGALTYTFDIENRGNTAAEATDALTVTDTFDPPLTITSVILNGVTLAEGTDYTYNQATGEFATVPGVITVPAATFTQNPDGSFTTVPGASTLIVNGTI